jgi:hypothetical protein
MTSFLRAFVWLRWRTLVNTLKGGRRRDGLERSSRALALAVAVLALLLSLAAAVGLGWLGFFSGRAMGEGEIKPEPGLLMVRILLLLLLTLLVLAPLGRSMQGPASGSTRFGLLPIPRATLHLARMLAGLLDPWILPVIPLLLLLPAGLAASGKGAAAGAAWAAGWAMLLVIAGVGSLASLAVQWFLRRRGRAEIAALLFLFLVSFAGMLPALLDHDFEPKAPARKSDLRIEDFERSIPRVAHLLPSELYGRAVGRGIQGELMQSLVASGGLLVLGSVLYALSARLSRHLLDSPEEGSARRSVAARRRAPARWPGLSAAASAVAGAQVCTTLRTVRGKFGLVFTGPMVAMIGLVLRRIHGGFLWKGYLVDHGYLLLGGASFMALTTALPVLANLFAVDRAGLTRQLLAPIRERDLLLGKLAGGGALFTGTLLLCMLGIALVLPGGSPALWAAGLAGGASVYLILAPLLALVSLAFPKASDLNKLGTPGNPHGAAALISTLATILACAAPSLLLALGYEILGMPLLTLGLMILWALIAGGVAFLLTAPLARALAERRDNLALIAEKR